MGAIIVLLIELAICVAVIAGAWKVFTKAGKPGWACLIPIYSTIVMLEIIGKPMIWFIFLLIPVLNIYYGYLATQELAKVFGKSSGFGIGLFLLSPIFIPMLGFSDATYSAPAGGAAPAAA